MARLIHDKNRIGGRYLIKQICIQLRHEWRRTRRINAKTNDPGIVRDRFFIGAYLIQDRIDRVVRQVEIRQIQRHVLGECRQRDMQVWLDKARHQCPAFKVNQLRVAADVVLQNASLVTHGQNIAVFNGEPGHLRLFFVNRHDGAAVENGVRGRRTRSECVERHQGCDRSRNERCTMFHEEILCKCCSCTATSRKQK